MMSGKKISDETTKEGRRGIYSRQEPGTLLTPPPVEGHGMGGDSIVPSERISRSPIGTPGAILEWVGVKGIPQDPGRVPSSKVDIQKGAEGKGRRRGSLSAQGAKVSGGERR
jgi:hypothetical protein